MAGTPKRPSLTDDDYWNASSASKISVKKGNIFDDSVDLQSARNLLTQSTFDDDDENDDCINFDGSEAKSARYRAPQQRQPTIPPVKQEKTFPKPLFTDNLTNNSDPNINNDISSNLQKRQPSLSEVSKLEAKINSLTRELDYERKDKFAKIPIQQTVRRIIFGQPYSLELYKSREDKLGLLDCSIEIGDGNAITAAVLHLKKTIKSSIFNLELQTRPLATEHYINYLKMMNETQELLDLLSMLGRNEEAALLKYKQCLGNRQAESKIKNLEACYIAHFQMDSRLEHEGQMIQQHKALLERQLPIEAADEKAERGSSPRFQAIPRAQKLPGCSVMTTLYYACLYHYEEAENLLSSPIAIKKAHDLTEKQFVWSALTARARLKQWNDIEALFQMKNWFGKNKVKSIVGFDRVVFVLSKVQAPIEVLNHYCYLIDDYYTRLEYAKKYKCHTVVLETLRNKKDKKQIEEYFQTLTPKSQEWFFAKDILSSNIKWKT